MTLTRRELLVGALTTGAAACVRGHAVTTTPPSITHGVQSGDVSDRTALVWARCSEPARMLVEWDTTERFDSPRRVKGPLVDPTRDFTGLAQLVDLPPEQTISYRVRFEREASRGASAWTVGTLQTPRADGFRFAWSGDTCGQGYGRNPDWGGLRGYQALHDAHPRFFLNSGDLFYADDPILPEKQLATGGIWKNISNERVARVAQDVDDFRARLAYNLEDEHYAAFAQSTSVIAQWDDHETHNNWYPGGTLTDDRYRIKDMSTLAARARQAIYEWVPIASKTIHRTIHYGPLLDVFVLDARSFRTPNNAPELTGTQAGSAFLGADQAAWLVDALSMSKARWKIVACDQPVGLVIADGDADHDGREGLAGRDGGQATGREVEFAQILAALQTRRVKNIAWLTADVHYAAAHYYNPERGAVSAFDGFWEFVAGPIHAGTFGPNELDQTFGGEVRFQWAPPPKSGNLPPWEGLQSFGTVDVAPDALTVSLWGIDGKRRYRVELPYVG
ncbi:MAG: alkaline phosphatase D family protein [Proteobacteria bacterium]|nr:alkaline phosphatase D family protein [Pseudomonadota bacterium]